jgi:hypothetical protein
MRGCPIHRDADTFEVGARGPALAFVVSAALGSCFRGQASSTRHPTRGSSGPRVGPSPIDEIVAFDNVSQNTGSVRLFLVVLSDHLMLCTDREASNNRGA